MKRTNQLIALGLAVLLGSAPLAAVQWPSFAAESSIPDKVLFSSSFEADEKAPAESKSDNGYYNNLEAYKITSDLGGEFTNLVNSSSIDGSADDISGEGKANLFDASSATKYLSKKRPSASDPVWVSFALTADRVLAKYTVTSANDEDGRDPKAWTLYGSADGKTYAVIDRQSNQKFSGRGQTVEYTVSDPKAYRYYKLEITENNGADMTQLADLRLSTGEKAEDKPQESPMATVVGSGPVAPWNKPGAFDGASALAVWGKKTSLKDSYARNVLYSGLNIKVTKNTQLSYVHFPALHDGKTYDFEYTSMHMVIDVKFTDGTYLSELSAVDQNGFGMDPVSKGESDALYTEQWNYIETCLGDVAEGKTIDSVYVYFRMNEATTNPRFLAYFDDLVIEDKAPVVHEHLSDYILTTRGTNCTTSFSRGLTTPFITMPNGFNFIAPITEVGSNQPYHYQNNTISQFSVSHVPSTWVGDYGTWQFMANTSVDIANMKNSDIESSKVGATYDHDNEIAKAHYYSVTFDEGSKASGVQVEMTPTTHGVYVRFTFPQNSDNVNIIFDCVRAGGSLSVSTETGVVTATSEHTNNGSSHLKVYGEFDQKPAAFKESSNGKTGIVSFPAGTTEVTFKFATSFLSGKQAEHNLELEIPEGDTFDTVFAKAQKAWDDVCGIIEIEGASYTQMVTFYSNLYRLYAYPNLYSENEGTNDEPKWVYASPYNGGKKTEGKLYVNNGFWDTYRTTWAAYALLTPTLDTELLNGLVQHYKDNGWVPRWIAPGGTNSMVGTSSDVIFADAFVKGIEFDYENAYLSMLRNASTVSSNLTNGGRERNDVAPFIGYVPNSVNNGFSWTMEGYINDYGIAVMAEKLGKTDDAIYYYNRALSYVNLYNPTAKFFMGKNENGDWSSGGGYNPAGWWGDYTETNGWTMFFASGVYDGIGLANLIGGKDALSKKLDDYFDNSITAMKKVQAGTIHEMMEAREVRLGQYGHSNQPAHAIPYLYAYAGQPYKTQALVRDILSRLYVGSEIGQGYCGDEDNGEMSGWYILSALGFYPQNMGSGQYIIGAPLFDKVTVHLESGKDLVIEAKNNSADNVYVQSMTVDGTAYNDSFISHADLVKGGHIVFEMGSEPSTWGTGSEPKSVTIGTNIPDPAEDLVTGRVKVRTTEFTPDGGSGVYTVNVDGGTKLFDNTSKTYATVSSDSAIVWAKKSGTALKMITLTSNNAKRAPSAFKLEASNDGIGWITLDRRDLSFHWNQYTRAFAVPAEAAGIYCYYRITFEGGGQLAEVEFVGEDAADQELTQIVPTHYDNVEQGGNSNTGNEDEKPSQQPTDPGTAEPSEDSGWLIPIIVIAISVGLVAMVIGMRLSRKKK
ncbi:MAG: GH92 family glycosyl hydrolase [Clostridia bacterium]|nr:GH92 family glycosyl hydrolase [Clostridia bacterium]